MPFKDPTKRRDYSREWARNHPKSPEQKKARAAWKRGYRKTHPEDRGDQRARRQRGAQLKRLARERERQMAVIWVPTTFATIARPTTAARAVVS